MELHSNICIGLAINFASSIDKTVKEIVQMVYELYGLKMEVIKIVEGV
jgi:hypothetical protein